MEGSSMGQVRHGSATTTHVVRAAIQRSQASLAQLSRELGINPKTVAKWRKRATVVDMRKRLLAQIAARRKQDIPADVEGMDADLRAMLNTQVGDLERRIESVIAQEETAAAKARLLRSIPGIGPVSAAMLIAEMPELGRMTSGEAAAMTGLALLPHDSGAMRGKRAIAGGRRSLRHVVFQAALAAACHNPVLKLVAQHLKMRGKPHKLVIVAIARRLVTIANAILKAGVPWRQNPVT